MSKSIVQRVKYLKHLTISEYDRDQIDPIVYLNVFKDGDTLYGFKEYDYFRNGAIKSKEWELGSYMNLKFIKKDIQTINKEEITIITRAKVVN